MGVVRRPLIVIPRGVLVTLPAQCSNDTSKPKGLLWEYLVTTPTAHLPQQINAKLLNALSQHESQ